MTLFPPSRLTVKPKNIHKFPNRGIWDSKMFFCDINLCVFMFKVHLWCACFCAPKTFNNMYASWKCETIMNLHLLQKNFFIIYLLWLSDVPRLSKELGVQYTNTPTLTLMPWGPGLPLAPGMPGGPARPRAPVIPASPSGPGAPCYDR